MGNMLFENGLWKLISQSDLLSKGVLVVLLLISVICWTVFFYKLILLKFKKKHIATVTHLIKNAKSIEEISAIASGYSGTIPGYIIAQNLLFLKDIVEQKKEVKIEYLTDHLTMLVDDMIVRQGSYLSVLSTSAAVSPLLGLFGTVWGLIHAFIGISQQQGADIATVAPGIAEALITTFGGLVVAIPAVAMFNYLASQTHWFEAELVHFSDIYRSKITTLLL